jgi:predicted transcriptional regulator
LQSFSEVSTVLKAISEPNRLKILIFLLSEPQSFQDLLAETNLKKTALANHLTSLKSNSLIEKIHHGTYRISNDGRSYLQAIENMYQKSEARKISEQRYQFTKAFLERNK